jgi:hypothetical protein
MPFDDQVRRYLEGIRRSDGHAEEIPVPNADDCIPAVDLFRQVDLRFNVSDDPFEHYAVVKCALARLRQLNVVDLALERLPTWCRICLWVGAFKDALQLCDFYADLSKYSDTSADMEILRYRAKAQRNLGAYNDAEATYRNLLRLALRREEAVDISVGLLYIGKLNGNYRAQHSLFASFVQEARSRLEASLRAGSYVFPERLLGYLAIAYDSLGQAFRSNDTLKAKSLFRKAIRLGVMSGRDNVASRSRCHLLFLNFQSAPTHRRTHLLKVFEDEILLLLRAPAEEAGLAIRWLQYATMLAALGRLEDASDYIRECTAVARKYNAHKILARCALVEYQTWHSLDTERAVHALIQGRNYAAEHKLPLQESEMNLRLVETGPNVPRGSPPALELLERNREIYAGLIRQARDALSRLDKPGDATPEFCLLSRKTRELFRSNLVIDYQQAVDRLDRNIIQMKALLNVTERRRQQAVALGISNSVARSILHEVKLNLDERTGRSPVVNAAAELRTTADLLMSGAQSGRMAPDDVAALVTRIRDCAARLEHFDEKIVRMKELLVSRLRRIKSLDQAVSLRSAVELAIDELRAQDSDLSYLADVRAEVDIEVLFERELMITVIQNLIENAIQARRRHGFTGTIVVSLSEHVIELSAQVLITEPVMRIGTSDLSRVEAEAVCNEISSGLAGNTVSSSTSTGVGLELAEKIFVDLMAGSLAAFKQGDEAGLEIVFRTIGRPPGETSKAGDRAGRLEGE